MVSFLIIQQLYTASAQTAEKIKNEIPTIVSGMFLFPVTLTNILVDHVKIPDA